MADSTETTRKNVERTRKERTPPEADNDYVLGFFLVAFFSIAGIVAQTSLIVFLFKNGGKDGLLRLLANAKELLGF